MAPVERLNERTFAAEYIKLVRRYGYCASTTVHGTPYVKKCVWVNAHISDIQRCIIDRPQENKSGD